MSKQKVSPRALKICGLTLLCLAIMFGVAAANKAKGGERLVAEYTIADETLPRHVKFETMPEDLPQMAAAWYFKYKGLGQFEMCGKLFPEDQLESLNFQQEDRDFKDGKYIREYIVHEFETLPEDAYAESAEHYSQLAVSYGYREYKVVRVSFSQKWSSKALEEAPQWGDGEYTRDFVVGKVPAMGENVIEKVPGMEAKWEIFELGMM